MGRHRFFVWKIGRVDQGRGSMKCQVSARGGKKTVSETGGKKGKAGPAQRGPKTANEMGDSGKDKKEGCIASGERSSVATWKITTSESKKREKSTSGRGRRRAGKSPFCPEKRIELQKKRTLARSKLTGLN